MRSWFRRHLNPPTMISIIALCVAVGGGYAIAFSGSGSVERANEVGIPLSGFETVAKLTGVTGFCRPQGVAPSHRRTCPSR